MTHKRTKLALLASAVLAGAFAFGGALAQEKGTIKIVTHSPLSGPNSPSGEAIKLGAQLALEDYGKLIPGFKVTLQPEDDQANPTVGVVYDVQLPCANGVYVAGATNTSQLCVTYDKFSGNGR